MNKFRTYIIKRQNLQNFKKFSLLRQAIYVIKN
jgi:hypothetical protein